MTDTNTLDDKHKHAPAVSGVSDLILRRWSPRAFSSKPVSAADLHKLFEAARWAASAYNEQPWRFLVGHKGDATYQKLFESLVEFNQLWAGKAPVLILTLASKKFHHNGYENTHARYDAGAATALLMLQATHQGLHAHSMSGFDPVKAREALHIPEDFDVITVTAVGHLGDPAELPEAMQEMEKSPRGRKPVEELAFSEWEKPFAF